MNELNREIAELRGWRDLRPTTYWQEDFYDTREVAAIMGTSPGGQTDELVPDWAHDEGAALSLLAEFPGATLSVLGPGQSPSEWEVIIDKPLVDAFPKCWVTYAETPALAICRAWLRARREWNETPAR